MFGAKLKAVAAQANPALVSGIMLIAMTQLQEEEVEQAKQYTLERPSNKSVMALGRVDSGEMLNAISGETFRSGNRGREAAVTNRVGFLKGAKDYYTWQTVTGFMEGGYRPDQWIEPTHALRDAHQDAIDKFPKVGEIVMREIMVRIRRAAGGAI
jgi:hypothetical protein